MVNMIVHFIQPPVRYGFPIARTKLVIKYFISLIGY